MSLSLIRNVFKHIDKTDFIKSIVVFRLSICVYTKRSHFVSVEQGFEFHLND